MESNKLIDKVSTIVLGLFTFILLLFAGGFNSVVTFLIGIAIGIFAFVIAFKKKCNLSLSVVFLCLLGIIYFISTFINNVIVTSIIASCVPFALIGYVILIQFYRKLFLKILTWLGFITAILGILLYFIPTGINGTVASGRLMFPFQYANTSGLWFCITAVLLWHTGNDKLRLAVIVPIISLLLTKSSGSIIVFAIISIIYLYRWIKIEKHENKYKIVAIAVFILCSILAVIFCFNRIEQASQTFIERIIQIKDGFSLLITSPLFGIGPDTWQFLYPYIQSAQYTASKIHCGYMQILLDGGIISFVIFFSFVIYCLIKGKNKFNILCSFIILVHSMIDFDLSYPFILLLLIFFLDSPQLKFKLNPVFAVVGLIFCGIGLYNNIQLNKVVILPHKTNIQNNYPKYIAKDPKASTYITIALNRHNQYQEAVEICKSQAFATSTQLTYAIDSLVKLGKMQDASDLLDKSLFLQPYNVDLHKNCYEYIKNNNLGPMFISVYNKHAIDSNNKIAYLPEQFQSSQKKFDIL